MTAGPGPDRTGAPGTQATLRLDRSLGLRLVGLALAIVGLLTLVVGGVHSLRVTAARAGASSVASARLDDAYYRCLSEQVDSLVRPDQVVDVSTAEPGAWVTLAKVVAPRDVLTTDPGRSTALLSLVSSNRRGTCLGSVVVARYPDGTSRHGTGGTLAGHEAPPATPL